MQAKRRQPEGLKSSITPDQFGKAMAELDLKGVPKHRRQEAVMDQVAKVMAGTIHDRAVAIDLTAARLLRQKRNG